MTDPFNPPDVGPARPREDGPQCLHVREDGTRCHAPARAVLPSGYCWVHENPSEFKQAQRRGGATSKAKAARAKKRGLLASELGPLNTIADAQRRLRLIAEAVGEGILPSSAGNTMLSATRAWLAAEDVRLRSEDLAELRQQLGELKRVSKSKSR